MRKTNYNFFRNVEVKEQTCSSVFCNTALVSNKIKLASLKKWVAFLFVILFSFSAKAQIDLTSTGGTTNASYTTLRDAFDAINLGTHTGTISISVTASTSEPGMDSLVSSGTGSASYTSILIKPAIGVTATISGNVSGNANGNALIKLCGADNVTIDGSNAVGGTSRDLTFTNTANVTATSTAVIWLGGLTSNGATGNTIKNCNVQGANRINNLAAIISASSSSIGGASLAANNNNTYQNNFVSRASNCITLLGFGTSPFDAGAIVSGNNVDSSNAAGILMSNQSGYNCFGNVIDKASNLTTGAASVIGMSFTNAHLNGNIYNNKVLYVSQRSATGAGGVSGNVSARGISLGSTLTASNLLVYNNFIGNIHNVQGNNAGNISVIGIGVMTTGAGYKIYNNTVNISTAPVNNGCFLMSFYTQSIATANGLDVRNNIFANTIPSAANGGVGQNYALYANGTSNAIYSSFDNNDFFTNFANIANYGGAARATLAAIQAVDGKNQSSVFVAPTFTSATDLHLSLVAGNAALNNSGVSVSGVTTDIDGATRSTNYPDMGADEIVYTPKISGFSPASVCAGGTVTINGADFTGTTAVSLAGVAASSFTVVSTSQINAFVASGYTSPVTGTISVTNASGSATSTSSLTRLAPGTYSSKSLSTGSVGDQVLINGADLLGATAVTFNGTTASFSVTNSTEVVTTVPSGATSGNLVVTDICGNAINAGIFTVVAANPCSTPSAQATNFAASATSTTALNGTFTPATGSPSGYVVVYSTSALSSGPVDGQTYAANGSLGGGTIKQVSASSSVSLTGLTGNTSYTITVFAYNGGGCTGGPLYNTTSPLVYTFVTCPNIPNAVTATAVGDNTGNSINFTWSAPTGGGANSLTYTVEVTSDAAYTTPVSGSPYTTSSLSQSVTGLNLNTKYYYRIKANNGCSSVYVSGNKTTVCGAGTILPFAENFDAVVAPTIPTCWTTVDNNADGITWTTAGVTTGVTGQSNPNTLRYSRNTVSPTVAADDWAISPGFKLTGGTSYTLSFAEVGFTNSGENLTVQYSTVAGVTGQNMTSGSTLYTGLGLVNQAFATQVVTFTPTNSGVYYFGFHCTSPNANAGALLLYVDNFRLEATPPPPSAPSSLSFTSVGSSSITVNWTDNSSNEVGFYVYSSTDGSNYTLQNTVGADVTSSAVGNLNSNTQYYFKVTSYNYGGENTSGATGTATTTDCGGIYTTNTYIGTLVANQVKNWNLASNWSLGHAPLSCEDVVINANNLGESSTSICYLYLNANASMHNLTITGSNTPTTSGTRQALFVYTNGYNMLIGGNLTMSNDSAGNAANANDNVLLIAGGAISPAVSTITVNGTTTIGNTGNRLASLGGASGFANIILKGDVVLGPQAFLNYGSLVYYIFDANGNQTLTTTSTQTDSSSTYGLGNFTVGNTNNTTLTLAGSGSSPASAVVGDFLINSGSSLVIPSGQSLNRTANGGTFTMASNTSLKVGGSASGVGNSNFPSNFAAFSLDNSSTVEYNGSALQTIASAPVYGNLKINNAAGTSLSSDVTVNNVLTFASGKIATSSNKLLLGLSATVSGASSTSYVNGTLAKTKQADNFGFLNFEIGDASQYTPVFVGFNGLSNSGGVFSAKTTAGTPTSLGYARSGISATNYLNRTYTLSNNGITGFTSISPAFTYGSADLIGNTSNAAYKVADSLYGGGWSLASTSSPTATSTQGTLVAIPTGSSADFVIGEIDPAPIPDLSTFTPTSACEGSNYVITGNNFYAITGVTIGGVNVPIFTVNSANQITITVPVAIGNGVIAVSNATGTATTAGSFSTLDQPQTTVSSSAQTICSGDAIATIILGNTNNLSGTTYSWTRAGSISGGTNASSGLTDIGGTLTSSSTVPVTATYSVTSSANGCSGTTVQSTVTVKASPGTITVSPSSASICQNVAQQLVGSYTAATGSSVTNSGAITIGIPDANIAGANTILNVNNIPAGAIITGVDVGFSITHTYNSDIAINLTAPNGKTLNLVYQEGGAGHNFSNTVISSTGVDALPIDSTDNITGTYAPDAIGGAGPSAFKSNVSNFSGLYSVANGNWRLSARDYFSGDAGTITNWNITIYYTLSPTFNWTKVGGGFAGLYTDAGFTAYTGGSQQTVYAKNTAGSYSYTANITHNGCTASSNTATVDIEAVPVATRTPASQTVCSGTPITSILLASSNDPTASLTWTRDNTTDVTGIVASGSGDIAGTLTNLTSSPITVTFTITPTGTGSQSCPGSPVTATVTVNPTPLASATPASQNSCSGNAITPIIFGTTNGVSGTNYTWTRDNTSAATGIAGSGTQFVSGVLTNTSSTTTVTFNITAVGPGASACAGTPTTATVTVYNPAIVYTVTGGGTFCSPGAGLPVGLSNSQSGYSYQLLINGSPAGSPVAGTGSALSFGNQVQSGTYTVVTTNSGCSTPMSGSAVISPIASVTPTINLITSNTTICGGTNATFFAVATNTGSNPSYKFTVNGITKQNTSSNVFITSTLVNSDVVSCVLTSNNTCQTAATTASNDLTITVNSSSTLAAPAAITGSTTQCTIGGISYLGSTTTGGVWSSSNPSVASVVSVNGKVTGLANGTAIISYTVSGSNGCTNSASVAYTVAEQATLPAITGLNKVCSNGGTITLSNATSGGVWSSNNTLVVINPSTGVVTSNANTTNAYSSLISYKVTNAAGCSKTATYNVTVAAIPNVPTITYAPGTPNPQAGAPTGSFCINKTFSVVGSPTGGTWSSTNSSVLTVSALGSVHTAALGAASLRYTVTNANGCSNSRSMSGTVVNCASRGVNLNDAPKPEFDFNLYPNPAKGSVAFNAEFAEAGGRIVLTDMYGKTVKTQMLSLGTNTIDINNLSKGFYLVNIITIDGKKTKKLIVE